MVINDFQMPDEINGNKITLKRVSENDQTAIQNICDALFYNQTAKRIDKVMAGFSDGPEDIPSLIKSLNQCFKKNGFNYFIFRGDEAIGQVYGFPCCGGSKSAISIAGWISDKALRQGYMKEAVKLIEDEHFSKNSDSLEIFIRVNPIIDAFAKSVKFYTQEKGEVCSYFRHRADWLIDQKPQVIMHHDNTLSVKHQNVKGKHS
jgi:RimJ/RimL family protein N-acetyltransferase